MEFFRREIFGRGQASRDEEVAQPSLTRATPSNVVQNESHLETNTGGRTRRFSLSRPTLPYLLRGRSNAEIPQQVFPRPEMREQSEIESPKTPTNRYTLTLSNFSTSRLELPHLMSPTSTNGIRSPTLSQHHIRSPTLSAHLRSPAAHVATSPSLSSYSVPDNFEPPLRRSSRLSDAPAYPYSEVAEDPVIAQPTPAVTADRRQTIRFHGVEPGERRQAQESQLQPPTEEDEVDGGRSGSRRHRRRKKRRRHRHHDTSNISRSSGERAGRSRDGTTRSSPSSDSGAPKRFLFCFPWIKSQRVRNQILTCFVSGLFLLLMLAVYLALTLTHQISSSQFAILIILIILFTTIIFCHALIRLCLYVVKPPREDTGIGRNQMSHFVTPGGYAIPRQPIRVVLARDEEAAGINSETVNTKPPAYGLWRESVRVDPNRIYWQRNEEAEAAEASGASGSGSRGPGSAGGSDTNSVSGSGAGSTSGSTDGRSDSPRPPSYVSDDGVDYVVDARPRSMAPTTDVPLPPHPSETGSRGHPAPW